MAGATIQLYAVGSTGYASASTPLLSSAATTDANGNFTITNTYTCPAASTLVYLTATGGNPGLAPGTNNPQLVEMAALGKCGDLTSSTFIAISELTTVAAVWPLAPFMTDYQHVGTSSTNAIGLANAFLSAASLADVNVPNAPGIVPSGVTAPVAEVNTLANILAACVNSSGGVAGDATVCGNLMAAATKSGVAPTDTVSAALGIAQQPGTNVATLFALSTATAPFQPGLPVAPNDWTVTMFYTNSAVPTQAMYVNPIAIDANQNIWVGYGTTAGYNSIYEYGQDISVLSPAGFTDSTLNGPYGLAFDLTGNLWIANTNVNSITEYGSNGSFVKNVTGGGLAGPANVAVDQSNNVWVANFGSGAIYGASEFTNAGTAISPSSGYTGGGISANGPSGGIAIDATGNAWFSIGPDFALLGPSGVPISGSTGYSGGGIVSAAYAAIDSFGNVWAPNALQNNVFALRSNGQVFSPSGGFTGPGLSHVYDVAVDGLDHIWLSNDPNFNNSTPPAVFVGYLAELDTNGNILSPTTGYGSTPPYAGYGIAIDSSGNVWTAGLNHVAKCIGVAAPVATPTSVATKNGQLGVRP